MHILFSVSLSITRGCALQGEQLLLIRPSFSNRSVSALISFCIVLELVWNCDSDYQKVMGKALERLALYMKRSAQGIVLQN